MVRNFCNFRLCLPFRIEEAEEIRDKYDNQCVQELCSSADNSNFPLRLLISIPRLDKFQKLKFGEMEIMYDYCNRRLHFI